MAAKKYFVDINLNKNQITELSLENRNIDPISPVSGEIYFNNIDKKIKFYDGAAWQSLGQVSADYLSYKGTLQHADNEPTNSKIGDVYVFSSNGKTVFFNQQTVEIGDFIIYNGQKWDILQKNIDLKNATKDIEGLIKLASQEEVNIGIENTKAITPLTLEGFRKNRTLSSVLLFDNQAITANGLTLTHNLNNKNIALEFYHNDEKIMLDYKTISENAIMIKTTFDLDEVRVVIIGHDL